VYIDMDAHLSTGQGNSFKKNTNIKIKYQEFLDKMNINTVGIAMKDSAKAGQALKGDIIEPKFFKDLSDV